MLEFRLTMRDGRSVHAGKTRLIPGMAMLPCGSRNINRQEWISFVRKREMLDQTKARLEALEDEWGHRCQSIFERILAGADIEDGGRINEPGVRSLSKPPAVI